MANRILACDDEPDVLLIIRTALEGEGFAVETASGGAECLELAAANPPDLVILDVMMPGLSGFDVLHKLKENPATESIPVIMLTAMSERGKIKEALEAGVNFYLIKPFDFEDLVGKVNKCIRGELY